jgi:NitT/TauT family transport system ATP-binding protein
MIAHGTVRWGNCGFALHYAETHRPLRTMADIEVRNLSKTYATRTGRTIALQNVELAIRKDEFVTLVGPSGCGKSTLLKIINALIQPSRGSVLFNGLPLLAPSRDVGIVFQEPVLLPWRGILDNVLLPAEILGLDLRVARARAMDLLALVGLSGFERRYPNELSGGMQQRAAICRSLVHDPSVLLMDEPFAALDAMTREDLGFELLRIWNVHRKTVVFVTHHISEAILLADRVVAMSPRPGRIEKVLTVNLSRPRTLDMQFSPEFKNHSDEIRELIRH